METTVFCLLLFYDKALGYFFNVVKFQVPSDGRGKKSFMHLLHFVLCTLKFRNNYLFLPIIKIQSKKIFSPSEQRFFGVKEASKERRA